jgi:hypothetical protein
VTDDSSSPIVQRYDRPPGVAMAEMQADVQEAWRTRCTIQGDTEHRASALLNRTEVALQAANKPATIRTVWMLLGDGAIRMSGMG